MVGGDKNQLVSKGQIHYFTINGILFDIFIMSLFLGSGNIVKLIYIV